MLKFLYTIVIAIPLLSLPTFADERMPAENTSDPHLDFKIIISVNGQLIKLYDDKTWDYIKDPSDANEWFN